MAFFDRFTMAEFDALLADYDTDGAVCLKQVFTTDEITALDETFAAAASAGSEHLEVCEETMVRGEPRRFYIDSGLVRFAGFEAFLLNSVAAEIAGRFMRSNRVRYFADQLIVKEPGTRKPTPWHQDLPYWPVEGRQLCSMWLPIDPVDRDTGVMFVAGSHFWAEHSPREFGSGEEFGPAEMPRLPDFGTSSRSGRILSFDMEPGDCLLFHSMTVHGAPGNATPSMRRAFSIRWAGDDVRHRHRISAKRGRSVGKPERDGQPLDDADYPVLWISPGT